MNVIMTGGTGFIGRHVVQALVTRGINVTILTSKVAKGVKSPYVTMIQTSYSYCDLKEKLAGKNFDVFYHLGWAGVDGKEKNNICLQYSNVQIAVDMLRLAKQLKCNVFIAAGTVAEYTFNEGGVIDFSMKQTPNDAYGATKVAVHYLLESYAKLLNQDMIWVVLPSTFGEGRIGDNIITYTIQTLLAGRKPLYGTLTQQWDFLYVGEVAKALVEIAKRGKHNVVYGIGSGEYKTLKEYICTIRDVIDPRLPLGIGERVMNNNNNISACVNIEMLTADTGFVPQISFDEGIRRTIQSYINDSIENFSIWAEKKNENV